MKINNDTKHARTRKRKENHPDLSQLLSVPRIFTPRVSSSMCCVMLDAVQCDAMRCDEPQKSQTPDPNAQTLGLSLRLRLGPPGD